MQLNNQEKELINAKLYWFSQVIMLINEYTNLVDWRVGHNPIQDIQLLVNLLSYYDDEEYKNTGYPPEVVSNFKLLNDSLKNNIHDDHMFGAVNVKERKAISIGLVDLKSGHPYAYMSKWDEEYINADILNFECPLANKDGFKVFASLFRTFMAIPNEEIAVFKNSIKDLKANFPIEEL